MTENIYDKLSVRRKELQKQGLVPEWMTTAGLQLFESKYEYDTNGRSVRGQFERIAKTAASHTRDADIWERRFFNLIWNGWLSCSTPVLANMGTDRGLPVSCSGGYVEDSVDGFFGARHEAALLSKYGFGTSGYLGDIRPRGTIASNGVVCDGVVPVLKGFRQDSRDISQGQTRRGAWAGYIEIEHGDFWEVSTYLLNDMADNNIGWIVTDKFVQSLQTGDKEALARYQRVLKVKMVTGKGYLFFVDKVNRARPQCYKDLGLNVKASNLCVAPETKVLTQRGQEQIKDLAGKTVSVWNGEEYSYVEVHKTGENQKLLRVVTSSGQELECTEYHKWYVIDDVTGKQVMKRTTELLSGDKLIKFSLPEVLAGDELFDGNNIRSYFSGFYTGDGCELENGKQRLYFYGEKRKLLELFTLEDDYKVVVQGERTYLDGDFGFAKYVVPSDNFVSWFAGLCDADATIVRNGDNESLQLASVNLRMLKEIQLRLQEYGVSSKIRLSREAGEYLCPDGRGGAKLYPCKPAYRLLVSSSGLYRLSCIGFETYRLKFEERKPQRNAEQFNTIVDVIDDGRYDDTYCFTEPKRNMGVFNGILTGNCNEIRLFSDEHHTFTCVLSSLNLAYYDDWKHTDAVEVATVFLDCVAEEFIQRAKGIKGLEKAVRFTEKSRALGLGVCGFHTLLQKRMLPFSSFEAHMLNNEIFSTIRERAEKASNTLVISEDTGYVRLNPSKGWDPVIMSNEPQWCKGSGKMNTHLLAIAPTKSTALIMGGVSEGINPDYAMVFSQSTAAGDVDRVNPQLLKIMKERGVFTKKVIDDLSMNYNGSVQHVDWLSEHEKEVFKTAFEINQRDILRLAAARQRFIDQGQSLNLFFSSDEEPEYISEITKEAFLDENIHGLYYFYSQSGVQASKGSCEACN